MESRRALAELGRTFVPPPGLGWSRPRDVRFTAAGKALVAVATVLFLAALGVGASMLVVVAREARMHQAFDRDGVDVDAEVTRLWRGSGDSKRPMVAYRYVVDAQVYDAQSRVSLSIWRALEVGAAVRMRYLPSEPGRHALSGSRSSTFPPWLPYVVATLIACVAMACLLGLWRQVRLLSDGRAAPALVTKLEETHSQHGTLRSLRYEFPLLNGATASGKSAAPRKPPAVGSVICVIYDPDCPGRSMLYPLSLVKPAALS